MNEGDKKINIWYEKFFYLESFVKYDIVGVRKVYLILQWAPICSNYEVFLLLFASPNTNPFFHKRPI